MVRLVGVCVVHAIEDLDEDLRVSARDLSQLGAHLLVVFGVGWDADRACDAVVGGVDPTVGQVCLGDDLEPSRQNLLSLRDVGIAIREHRVVEERDGQRAGEGGDVG